jgi:hypothetical protein
MLHALILYNLQEHDMWSAQFYKYALDLERYDVALWILQLLSDLTALDNSITGNCR